MANRDTLRVFLSGTFTTHYDRFSPVLVMTGWVRLFLSEEVETGLHAGASKSYGLRNFPVPRDGKCGP